MDIIQIIGIIQLIFNVQTMVLYVQLNHMWKYGKPSGESSGYISYYALGWTSYDAEWTVTCTEYNNGNSAFIRAYSRHDNV